MRVFWLLVGLSALAGSAVSAQDDEDRVLVRYDFEAEDIDTGPYTLSVFDGASGSVRLSSSFRHSGFRSVEIRARAGDGAFSELQGYFSDKWTGTLFIHFAILVAEPEETLNVAFAGTSHFSMREHGLGIWFKTERGILHHVTAGRSEELFEIEAFTWYVFDVAYHVERGTYDVVIAQEDLDEPIVSLRDQANVVGVAGSQLRKYSFIGDIPGRDQSNALFYVDDIVITNDVPVGETPFVAPGRRLLFVDLHDYYQKRLLARPSCVPVLGYEDFDLSSADLAEMRAAQIDISTLAGRGDAKLPAGLSPFVETRLRAMKDWREGCRGGKGAAMLFERASEAVPSAKIYPMSEVLALVAGRRWQDADALFLSIYGAWHDDPRFPALAASIGLAREDLDDAWRWLTVYAESRPGRLGHPLVRKLWSGEVEPGLVAALQVEFPSEWPDLIRTALSAELRFYVLLWQARYSEARAFAESMTVLFRRMELESPRWLERQGDAAFYSGDYDEARSRYEEGLRQTEDPDSLFLKLSDTHFKLGDFELERLYREKIYGSLRGE